MKPAKGAAGFTHPTAFDCPTSKRTGRDQLSIDELNNLVTHRIAWYKSEVGIGSRQKSPTGVGYF